MALLSIPDRPECSIGGNKIKLEGNISMDLELNPQDIARDRSLFFSIIRVSKTAEGISLFGKLAEGSLRLAEETGLAYTGAAANRFADGTAVLTVIPSLPFLWFEVVKSACAIRDSKVELVSGESQRKWDKGLHRFCAAISSTAKAATVGLSLSNYSIVLSEPLKPFLSTVSLLESAVGLKMNVEDLKAVNRAIAEAKEISEECRSSLHQTKKRQLLALVKNVCSVIAALLGATLVATGIGLAPGIVLLVLGLSRTIFALWGKIYEEGMRWKPTDFFDRRHVVQMRSA